MPAAEAALEASPGGMFFWAIWNEWKEDAHGNVFDSDGTVRRLMLLDESTDAGGSGGDNDGPHVVPPRPGGKPTKTLIAQ